MKKHHSLLLWLFLAGIFCCSAIYAFKGESSEIQVKAIEPAFDTMEIERVKRPKIQVVFLLDATGSMAGLINTAKEKIWSIASSMMQTNPAPDLEVGILFYRDRGDAFITKQIPLGKNMDNLYEELMAMQATGGGDGPESVNQALYEGVHQMQWDNLPNTYRTIFLVGDYPPHMDYDNDVHYPLSCFEAVKKGIVINTILMGNEPTAARIWKEIAQMTKGKFINTDMNVNNIVVRSPYDDRINKLQYELDQTRLYYGNSSGLTDKRKLQSAKISSSDAAINARRAEYNLSEVNKDVYYGEEELINEVSKGKDLFSIKASDLPPVMQKMTDTERQQYVEDLTVKRKKLSEEIKELSRQRQEYIDKELAKMDKHKVQNSFDNVVFEAVQSQALKKEIRVEGKVKR